MRRVFTADFAVGCLALLGLLSMIFLSLQVNDRGSIRGGTRTVTATLDTATGLIPKTSIEVAGIGVGLIDSIDLDGDKAKVTLRLNKNLEIFKNATLVVKDRGVLGDKVLALNPGTPDAGKLGDGESITNTVSGGGFEELASTLAETSRSLKEALSSDNPQGALGQTILNLRDATGSINEIVQSNQARIDKILANVDHLTADLGYIARSNKEQIGELIASLKDVAENLNHKLSAGGDLDEAAKRLNATLASAENVMGKIEKGEGTIGKLVNDETTVNNLNEAIGNVNQTLGLVNRLQLNLRYRAEFLTQAEEVQNMVALIIAPSPDKFIMAEVVSSPQGNTNVTDTQVISNGTTVSSTKTVSTNDNVSFNILLGKRFWDATVRAGIMRNRGGIGLDYHLLNNKLTLSAEGFDFSRYNDRFHFRAYGSLVLYRYFILSGGVDDILTKTGKRNPFAAVGLQFTDNDFRAIIPAMARGF